jgi:hypothetical protein
MDSIDVMYDIEDLECIDDTYDSERFGDTESIDDIHGFEDLFLKARASVMWRASTTFMTSR